MHQWLTDPEAAPHGGESTVVVHAILATPQSVWRIDIAPLSRTVLSGRPSAWTLRSLASS